MLIIANLNFLSAKENETLSGKNEYYSIKTNPKTWKFYFHWWKINVRNIHILSILEFHSYTYPFLLFSSVVLFLSLNLSLSLSLSLCLSLSLFLLSVCHPIKMAIKVLNYVYHPLSILHIYLSFNLHFRSLHLIDINIYLSFSSICTFFAFFLKFQ